MIIICAHVPMSPRARTSVPDEWSAVIQLKRCGLGDSEMLTGILGGEQIYCVVLWDCCSSHQEL